MVRAAALQLHRCPLLILDEADQLLASNFVEDMTHIVSHAGKRIEGGRQTVLVSATLSPTVLRKFDRWCPEPAYVTAGGAAPHLAEHTGGPGYAAADGGGAGAPAYGWGVSGWDGPASDAAPRTQGTAGGAEGSDLVPTMPPALQHVYVIAEPRHRVDTLRRCVHALGAGKALVFMNFQQRLKDAQHKLDARNMEVGMGFLWAACVAAWLECMVFLLLHGSLTMLPHHAASGLAIGSTHALSTQQRLFCTLPVKVALSEPPSRHPYDPHNVLRPAPTPQDRLPPRRDGQAGAPGGAGGVCAGRPAALAGV
jgi:hypothetical protein